MKNTDAHKPLSQRDEMMYSDQPRTLTPREIAAMSAQCITHRYPED